MDSAVLLAVANHDRIVTLRRPLDQDTNELPQVLLVGVVGLLCDLLRKAVKAILDDVMGLSTIFAAGVPGRGE